MLKIMQAPSEVLSSVAKKIEGNPPQITREIISFIKEMEKSLDAADDPKGVGLAAPQVGKSISLFITRPSDKSKVRVFINPRIISQKLNQTQAKSKRGKHLPAGRQGKKLEGCLSLKDIWGEVKRAKSVELEYFDEKGEKHTRKFEGFMATIVQHEVDHLSGILFPKRVLEQRGQLFHSSKDEKGEMIFEPIEI